MQKLTKGRSTDTWRYIALAFAIYFLINFLPYFFGYAPIVGDNLTQNAPLRHLVAQAYLSGHLPLINIMGWSGTPLLAGFNAGAYFPLEVLYVILPTQVATLLFITLLQLTFGLGLRKLGRSMGYGAFAVDLIAISAPAASYFYAQTIHLDMASGIAVIPWALVAIYRQSKGADRRQSARNGLLLGVSYALVVLGGAPEAMLFGGAFIGAYLVSAFVVNRVDLRTTAIFVGAAVVVSVLLSAPQLLPGYSYIASSQRANLPYNYATAGPFYPQMFISLLTPFIFGSPSQILPNYQGPYTFEETMVYIGILPLLAALATLPSVVRTTKRRSTRSSYPIHESKRFDLIPLMIAGVISTLLSLGTFTPLESLMLHIPIYNKQRLPSRNILGFEISSLVLAMAGVEALLLRKFSKRSIKIVAFTISIVTAGVLTGLYLGGDGALFAFDGSGSLNPFGDILAVSSIPVILSISIAIAYSKETTAKVLKLAMASIVILDVISFDFFSYTTSGFSNQVSSASGKLSTAFTSLMTKERGRFAIYDPNLYYYFDEVKVGMPNLNTYNKVPSLQGYGSLSLANYEAATGSHQQATFTPSLPTTQLFSLLEGKVILTGTLYFSFPVGKTFTTYGSASLLANTQSTTTVTDHSYLGQTFDIKSLQLTYGVSTTSNNQPSVSRWSKLDKEVGVITTDGKSVVATLSTETTNPVNGIVTATYNLPKPVEATQIFAKEYISSKDNPIHAIATGLAFDTVNAGYFSVSGALAKTVTPYQFKVGPTYNALTAYIDDRSSLGNLSRVKPISPSPLAIPYLFVNHKDTIKLQRAAFEGPNKIRYALSSQSPTTIVASLAYNSGWHATIGEGDSSVRNLTISQCYETLTCITMPKTKGSATIDLSYSQKGASLGLLAGVAGVIITSLAAIFTRPKRKTTSL
ncbi:MAG: hypothetical protein M0019_02990 [Actinomycetota bacterium]|nr:hypothetical protein [Actinomycetota bacterium]